MYKCESFNQPMTLPDSIFVIPNAFMEKCFKFNSKLVLPKNLLAIGSEFLYDTDDFNQWFKLPGSLLSIGRRFLAYSEHFNQELVIPASVIEIGDSFLYAFKDFEVKNLKNHTNINIEVISRESHITGAVLAGVFIVLGAAAVITGTIYAIKDYMIASQYAEYARRTAQEAIWDERRWEYISSFPDTKESFLHIHEKVEGVWKLKKDLFDAWQLITYNNVVEEVVWL